MITDEMVLLAFRTGRAAQLKLTFKGVPDSDYKPREGEIAFVRATLETVVPLIAEREREECARIADAIAEQERGNPGEIWAERIADAIRERMP